MMNSAQVAALLFAAAVPALAAPAETAAKSAFPAAAELAARVTPDFAGRVVFKKDKALATGRISAAKGKLVITAPSTAEAIRTYGYYLRHIAHVHFSWNGDNKSAAHFTLPEKPMSIPASQGINYAMNYCTLSYSCTHWDKKRWAHELDVFALNGYTHLLVTAGLETVWTNFLKEIGYPEDKIAAFIPNPAFSAWWNMGNLEGAGGPVSPTIIKEEAELGRFIVQRMKQLGMTPVLQGYVGLLPHDIDTSKINGTVIPQGNWVAGFVRPAVLAPTSPDFEKYAAIWYKNMRKVYGATTTMYGGDLFHEGGNTGGADLPACAKAAQAAMQKNVPGSVWLLQAWAHNPSKAFLDGTDPEKSLVLLLDKDLRADHDPFYTGNGYLERLHVRNVPYVWCELANFGGNHGLFGGFGVLENYKSDTPGLMGEVARNGKGLGMISEGIETNPIYYALLTERMNDKDGTIDRKAFIDEYVLNRYGVKDSPAAEAWSILADTVYNPTTMREGCQESILCARPRLDADKASTWSDGRQYYDYAEVEKAAKLLLAAGEKDGLAKRETYRYDMADVLRQVLADRARVQLPKVKAAYDAKDATAFARESEAYLKLITDTAEVLACSKYFLLGAYLEGAAAKAGKDKEAAKQMTDNLKLLLTTWTKGNTSLNDYANRQLSELMSQYYAARWAAFFRDKAKELNGGAAPAAATGGGSVGNNGLNVSFSYEQNAGVDDIQNTFWKTDTPLLTKPKGDIITIGKRILGN